MHESDQLNMAPQFCSSAARPRAGKKISRISANHAPETSANASLPEESAVKVAKNFPGKRKSMLCACALEPDYKVILMNRYHNVLHVLVMTQLLHNVNNI